MRLLLTIKELNASGTSPTFNDLLQQCRFKSFLELCIFELKSKGYAEEISVKDEAGDYYRIAYKITEKGQDDLKRYTSQVQAFVSRLSEVFENRDDVGLYRMIEDKRELLWFAYYKGLITKSQVEDMARQLQVSTERIWRGDRYGSPSSNFVGFHPGDINNQHF